MRKNTNNKINTIPLRQAKEAIKLAAKSEDRDKNRIVPFIQGPPGQGKSAILEEVIIDLNESREEGQPEWTLINYRLAQCDPTDLKGVPVYLNINGKEFCSFAPPACFPYEGVPESADGKNVLIFLDELPQAPASIQNLAANIIDGRVGDQKIDFSRSLIVAAGNRSEDFAATFEIPQNVVNRMSFLDVKTEFSEWQDWAIENKLHSSIIGYLQERKASTFNEPPEQGKYSYGTPRSWHKVSSLLNVVSDYTKDPICQRMVEGLVGLASARDFETFYKRSQSEYSVNKILAGQNVPYPNSRDFIFSILLEITYRFDNWVGAALTNDVIKLEGNERVARLVKNLSKEEIAGINNAYKWFDSNEIDTAFKALLNKYQTPRTQNELRPALISSDAFKVGRASYINIHKVASSMK